MKDREDLVKKLALLEIRRWIYSENKEYCLEKMTNAYENAYENDDGGSSGEGWRRAAQKWGNKSGRMADKIHKMIYSGDVQEVQFLKTALFRIRESLQTPEVSRMIKEDIGKKQILEAVMEDYER